MANKATSEKNKPARKTLRPNEYYNPKTKRYEYHYKDCFGKERVISSYRLEMTNQLPKGKKSTKSLREKEAELNAYLGNNIDMDNRMITVDKQLQCINHTHVVLPTKTTNGVRTIPMTDGVYESFQRIIENRYLKGDIEPVCYDEQGNAYEGFVFLATRSRRTIVRGHVEEYLQNCIKRFNNANPENPIRKYEAQIYE